MLWLCSEGMVLCSGSTCHTIQYMQHCTSLYSWLYQERGEGGLKLDRSAGVEGGRKPFYDVRMATERKCLASLDEICK